MVLVYYKYTEHDMYDIVTHDMSRQDEKFVFYIFFICKREAWKNMVEF